MARDFTALMADQFAELARAHAAIASRTISEVHLHHTFIPDQALYRDLAGEDDRNGEAAGLELCRRMFRHHTLANGWRDIAQHVTIDPAGRIWLCRDWNLPPASATGHNGSSRLGPFMIEMIGNFDAGREAPSKAQWAATLAVIAGVQTAFALPPEALRFHNEMTEHKTCPGTRFAKDDVVKQVRAAHAGTREKAKEGPLDGTQREVHRVMQRHHERLPADTHRDDLGAEPTECSRLTADSAALTRPGGTRGTARGGAAGIEITPAMVRTLRRHVVHLRGGSFVEDGPVSTTPSHVAEMVQGIRAWARDLPKGVTPRVMVWAHGGLSDDRSAMEYAWRMHRWWHDNHIYPIFMVWETGVIETALQTLDRMFLVSRRGMPEERGFWDEVDDRLVELTVRGFGRPFWNTMKISARNASQPGDDRGAYVLAKLLAGLHKGSGAPKPQIHLVGHSAGAIFHTHLLDAADAAGLPIDSLTFLAPACTVDLFNEEVRGRIGSRVGRLRMFALDSAHERADPTVPVYDRSLLYLISRGFERDAPEPLLGLEESVRRDPDLIGFFGIGTVSGGGSVTWCPTGDDAPDGTRSGATVHGAFDGDAETLLSIRAGILGDDAPATENPPPEPPRGRGPERLYRPLEEVYPWLAEPAVPASPGGGTALAAAPPAAPVLLPAQGARLALSIGIDDYQGYGDLDGCVRDSELWTSALTRLGFEVRTLRNRDATRAGIHRAVGDLVAGARAGDVVALHYSGHGTQLPDLDGDESDDDGQDEALVPHDGPSDGEYFIDDDIRELLSRLDAEADFTFFADCCHSGTISRFSIGASSLGRVKTRYLRATPEMVERYRRARARGSRGPTVREGGEESMRHLLFAACKSSETAKESDGHGWFSKTATDILSRPEGMLTNRMMQNRLEQEFHRQGYSKYEQTPQLEGRAGHKDRPFLGGVLR